MAESEEMRQADESVQLTDEQEALLVRRAPDDFLGDAVHFTNSEAEGGRSDTITLLVKGTVVCGVIIANWLWAELLHEDAVNSKSGEIQETTYSLLSKDLKKREAANKRENNRWEELTPDERRQLTIATVPGFIHLENAQILAGGNRTVPREGTLWRGRLSEVDGWFLGRLVSDPT